MNKFILIAMSVLLLAGCKDKKKHQTESYTPSFQVSTPIVQDIVLKKEYPGYLSSDKTVNLVARVSGTLQTSYLVPGAKVRKGDLIFVIEPTTYEDEVKQAEAQLATSQAQLDYAKSNYERMKEAAKSGAVSQIQVLQAESNTREYEAAIKQYEAALNTAKTNLSYCYIRAPFDGRVTVAAYSEGNYINGSAEAVTLATLYKDDIMYAYFNIEDNQFLIMQLNGSKDQLPEELKNKISIGAGPNRQIIYDGTLDYLSPNIDLSTGTLNLRAVIKNPDGDLKNGLYVTITLPYSEQKDAVLITDASIATDQLGKYIYVVNDSNIVNYRHIEVGETINDTLRQVTKGLSPNEKYITSALLKVKNGMKINPVK